MFNRSLPAAASSGEHERSEEQPEDPQSGGFTCVPPDIVGVPFPTAAYDQNLFYKAVGYLLGLAMTMVSQHSSLSSVSQHFRGIAESSAAVNSCRSRQVWRRPCSLMLASCCVLFFRTCQEKSVAAPGRRLPVYSSMIAPMMWRVLQVILRRYSSALLHRLVRRARPQSTMYPLSRLVKGVVEEKESRVSVCRCVCVFVTFVLPTVSRSR